MTLTNMETIYEAMARALDQVGPENNRLFLAKLALALATELAGEQGNANKALTLIATCQTALPDDG